MPDRWNCTEGQSGVILRILNENKLTMQEAEDLSRQLFGIGVPELNNMLASQVIEDLLIKVTLEQQQPPPPKPHEHRRRKCQSRGWRTSRMQLEVLAPRSAKIAPTHIEKQPCSLLV